MFAKVKEWVAKWQVKAAIVGGVLVVGSVFGTCSFEPASSVDAPEASEATESSPTTGTTESSTTTGTTESSTTTGTTESSTTTVE